MSTNLYAIRTLDAPFVKIGTALKPRERLAELQTGCPHKLYIYAVRAGASVQEEKALHRKLNAFRSRDSGEWFLWEGAVVDEVKTWGRSGSEPLSGRELEVYRHFRRENRELVGRLNAIEDLLNRRSALVSKPTRELLTRVDVIADALLRVEMVNYCAKIGARAGLEAGDRDVVADAVLESSREVANLALELNEALSNFYRFNVEDEPIGCSVHTSRSKQRWRDAERLLERIRREDALSDVFGAGIGMTVRESIECRADRGEAPMAEEHSVAA